MSKRKELRVVQRREDDLVTLGWGPFEVTIYTTGPYYTIELRTYGSDNRITYTGDLNNKELTVDNISDWFYNKFIPEKKKSIIEAAFSKNNPISILYSNRW